MCRPVVSSGKLDQKGADNNDDNNNDNNNSNNTVIIISSHHSTGKVLSNRQFQVAMPLDPETTLQNLPMMSKKANAMLRIR